MSKKYAVVKFLSSKDEGYSQGYTYENTVDAKVYDAVIVPTRYGTSLAVVTELTDKQPDFGYGNCTIKSISEVIKSDTIAAEMKTEKKKDLKKKLSAKAKKMDEIKLYEMYAKDDSEFAELLKEYKEL